MANILLTDNNLKKFIESLKLPDEQKNFLLDELPKLDEKERLELMDTLKDVYILNEEEKGAIEKMKKNWQQPKV
jgi:hypothetical protein